MTFRPWQRVDLNSRLLHIIPNHLKSFNKRDTICQEYSSPYNYKRHSCSREHFDCKCGLWCHQHHPNYTSIPRIPFMAVTPFCIHTCTDSMHLTSISRTRLSSTLRNKICTTCHICLRDWELWWPNISSWTHYAELGTAQWFFVMQLTDDTRSTARVSALTSPIWQFDCIHFLYYCKDEQTEIVGDWGVRKRRRRRRTRRRSREYLHTSKP